MPMFCRESDIISPWRTDGHKHYNILYSCMSHIGRIRRINQDNFVCGGVLEQISKDHVAVAAFGVKPPLSQNLGIPPTELIIDPYLAQGAYNDGDVYLICSDGLTDMVPTEEISGVLASKPVDGACMELLEKALANGGRDNITVVLCRIERESWWPFKRKRRMKKGEV